MDRIPLKANDRTVFGKKVKNLRKAGKLPAHVYGNTKEVEHIEVNESDFKRVYKEAGETGLVNLKIGEDRNRPVLIKEVDVDPVTGQILHVGFYQVNLKEKVEVPVPIVLVGEEVESVKLGQTVVLQNMSEVLVEALPNDLIEKIEVNIEVLKEVGDAITVADLNYDRSTIEVKADPEEIVVKLDEAVTEEMKALMEEQAAEQAAAAEAAEAEAGEDEAVEGEEAGESEEGAEATSEGGAEQGGEASTKSENKSEETSE